jgi:DNA-binding response OmpR family regulator
MPDLPTLLVVEDNEPLAHSLSDWLHKEYIVEIVTTGQHAISLARPGAYEIIVLDLGLPDISGKEVCATLRENGVTTPILILTASDEVSTKIDVLDCGADDYLLKPFHIGELQARLRALLRRRAAIVAHNAPLIVGDLSLEPARRSVHRCGQAIRLRRKEFDILEYMMRNSGTVLTRAMIINNAWDAGTERWNNTVDVHIKYLRDKIDKPFSEKLIKTAYGTGYVIDQTIN